MLDLSSIMIGTTQPEELVSFDERVLDRPAEMEDREHGFWGWQAGNAYFSVLEHSEMQGRAKDPGRVMMNFLTAEVKEEFQRMASAGAAIVREPYEMGDGWIATLADPDGNYFQLVTPIG